MTPTPITYVGVMFVGTALGILAEALWGISWWIVALGALVVTWGIFLASALSARRMRGGPAGLRVRALAEVAPGRAKDLWDRRERTAFEGAPFPLYGLDRTWSGPRWIGGWGESSSHGPRLTLAHGDVHSEGAAVARLTMSREPGGTERAWMTFELLHSDAPHWQSPPRTPVTIPVDGRGVEFHMVRLPGEWFAIGAVAGTSVAIEGTNIEVGAIKLERISDLKPYFRDSPRRRAHH